MEGKTTASPVLCCNEVVPGETGKGTDTAPWRQYLEGSGIASFPATHPSDLLLVAPGLSVLITP